MVFCRLMTVLLALFCLTTVAYGQDFQVGDAVVVATDSATVKTGELTLGSIARDTRFVIRQQKGDWLLSEFQIGNKTVLGWVQKKTVRHADPDSTETKTHRFTWENLFLARVKLDRDYDFEAHVDDYLKTFRSDVWKQYHDDEFQLEKKRAEALRIFKQRVEDFDLDQEFIIPSATVNIEKYDFKKSAFPIKEATNHHYWKNTRSTHSDFPGRLSVFFKNPELMRYLPMPPDEAEKFLASRKDSYGEVDRELLAFIRLRICERKNEDGDELLTEIVGVRFYSDGEPKQFLYATPEAPPEAPPATLDDSASQSSGSDGG